MGMFDNVHYNGKVFQTKDFDEPYMDNYYIDGGRLLKSVGHTEDRSEAGKWEKEHPGEELPERLKGLLGIGGCMTLVETGREDLNFHGVLNFYRLTRDTTPHTWEEYNAKFTDGQLVSIEEVPETP